MAVLHHPEDIKHITQTNFNNYCIGDLRRMVKKKRKEKRKKKKKEN